MKVLLTLLSESDKARLERKAGLLEKLTSATLQEAQNEMRQVVHVWIKGIHTYIHTYIQHTCIQTAQHTVWR